MMFPDYEETSWASGDKSEVDGLEDKRTGYRKYHRHRGSIYPYDHNRGRNPYGKYPFLSWPMFTHENITERIMSLKRDIRRQAQGYTNASTGGCDIWNHSISLRAV